MLIATLSYLVLLVSSFPVIAIDIFALKETLLLRKTIDLDIEPISVLINGDQILVLGVDADDNSIFLWIDSSDLSEVAKTTLELVSQEVLFTSDRKHIIVLGKSSGTNQPETELYVLDRSLRTLGKIKSGIIFESPASFLTSDDKLYVYDRSSHDFRTSGKGFAKAYVFDISNRAKPNLMQQIPFQSHRKGVVDFWLLNDSKTAVLNSAYSPSLDAFEAPSGYPLDSLSYKFEKSYGDREVQPFTVLALADDPTCKHLTKDENWAATFVLISNATRDLILASYDSRFKTMEVIARAPVNVSRQTTQIINHIAGTDIPAPTSFLAGSCDLSVIWVADVVNKRITQFARNPSSELLEQVGVLVLTFPPSAVALNNSGSFGVALSRELKRLSLFGEDAGATRTLEQRISGSADVRELQRVLSEKGFQVGPIDGIYGQQTERAVNIFEKTYELDMPKDYEKALETIKSINIR